MQARDLRDLATIQVRSTTDNAAGEPTLAWSDFAKDIHANVSDLSGREAIAAQAITNGVTTIIIIRYRAGVTAAMRVLSRGVIYNIQTVLEPENKRREMHLTCIRNVSNG